jgi:sigma-B regulation protein RsbU (phosphoserine phosphatase)
MRTVGVITLVGRRSNVRFSAGDERLLSAIASQVGAALETQRLVRESLRQERTLRELELAHDLQLKLLPDTSALEGPPEIAARCVPADTVGGDFYQLYRLPGNRIGLMIGDVSSHGFSAALIMALTLSAVSIYALEAGSPGEMLRRVHRALANELSSTEMFLSLFYGVLDLDARELTYVNAGHPHAFRIAADGQRHRLHATHPPLGMVELDNPTQTVVPWESAEDLLLLFTDGLSDALATDGSSIAGESRLVDEVVKRRTEPLDRIIHDIFDRAGRVKPTIPTDDRTAVIVRG